MSTFSLEGHVALVTGAGRGIGAACARAYAEAGADAVLIHSRDKSLAQIRGFLDAWKEYGRSVPLVAVPTLFPDFTAEELYEIGFQVVIWANQLMRASVQAMEDTLEILRDARKVAAADGSIATVPHLFDLVKTKQAIALEESAQIQLLLAQEEIVGEQDARNRRIHGAVVGEKRVAEVEQLVGPEHERKARNDQHQHELPPRCRAKPLDVSHREATGK